MNQLNFLFGAGETARNSLSKLQTNGVKIYKIIDNDVRKTGKEISGVEVISFLQFLEIFRDSADCRVFIATVKQKHRYEIKEQLLNAGIKEENVVELGVMMRSQIKEKYGKMQNHYNIAFQQQIEIWADNLLNEVQFWMGLAMNQDSVYHKAYQSRIQNQNFDSSRLDGLPREIKKGDVVLDVGCGIYTPYGEQIKDGEIQLIPIDPLAYYYNRINRSVMEGTSCDLKAIKWGMFELLSKVCIADSADYILIDNALDHCIDPFQAIIESLKVIKKNGWISLHHNIDEGVNAVFSGLHQWNICSNAENELVFWNESNYINITEKLKGYAEVKVNIEVSRDVEIAPYGHIMANISKIKELPIDFYKDYKIEMANIIEQLMRKMAEPSFCQTYIDSVNHKGV